MDGDLVFCFVDFGFLASVAVVGMTFLREEREREALLVLLHLRSGCCFFE